jgi:hypothetical protein
MKRRPSSEVGLLIAQEKVGFRADSLVAAVPPVHQTRWMNMNRHYP